MSPARRTMSMICRTPRNRTACFACGSSLMGTMRSLLGAGVPAWEILVVRPLAMLGGDWSGYGPEVWWSAAFFLGCGICTAVLLWQARCILSTIIAQTPFQRSNARSMKRAAASCWGTIKS